MSADEVFDFDPGEAPPQAALKLAIAEFGPTTARFLEQLAERFDVDEILYEMILSSIARPSSSTPISISGTMSG